MAASQRCQQWLNLSQHGDAFADWEATFTRNSFGQEVDRQLPGGARSYWWRDKLGRPTQHWVGRAEASARVRKYEWAPGDRLLKIVDQDVGEQEYEYDQRGALAKVTHVVFQATDTMDPWCSMTASARWSGARVRRRPTSPRKS